MPSVTDENASRAKRFDIGRLIDFLGSVKFGIALLFSIVVVSIIGMLVTQYNVTGFDQYLTALSEFRRTIFSALGFFDIYGTWYFKLLLMLLTMNIALSSVEHFPNAWKLIRRPPLAPSDKWLAAQPSTARFALGISADEAIEKVQTALRKHRFRRIIVTTDGDRTVVFAQSGAWNRLGAYFVHAALLLILTGGLITSQFSFSGRLPISAGESAQRIDEIVFRDDGATIEYRRLPFLVKCVDLQQILINSKGPIESQNSIDWLTTLELESDDGKTRAVVGINRPFDYGRYRFFHSTFVPIAKARSVTIEVRSASGAEKMVIGRGETVVTADGVSIRLVDFRADLSLTRDSLNENSTDYRNPAAILEVDVPGDPPVTAIAVRDNQPGDRAVISNVAGRIFRLIDFEKVSERHVLIVRFDPGTPIVYFGFAGLMASLVGVFFFSHKRIWIAFTPNGPDSTDIIAGGNANRDDSGFDRRFRAVIKSLESR